MKNSTKVRDYITNSDWFGFIENAVCNCPEEKFPQLLQDYLRMSDNCDRPRPEGRSFFCFN